MDHIELLKSLDYKAFLIKSDWLAWRSIACNYAIIIFAFWLPSQWLNPLTVIISVILLGNRQLGLGILMHDCVHGALFKTRALNQWVGEGLCAAPILAQFEGYRRYHLKHHAKAGTTEDPDYPNYKIYPVNKNSLARKVARDVFAVTGLKNFYILILMHAGMLEYDMSYQSHQAKEKPDVMRSISCFLFNIRFALLFHLLLIVIMNSLDVLAFYALWWVAFFTTFMLFSRIRNAAEHANVPDLLDLDPRQHARTVYANWLARLTVAPNEVNYHLEHHWLPAVPPYRLAAFHQYLLSHGALQGVPILKSYAEVIKALVRNPTAKIS